MSEKRYDGKRVLRNATWLANGIMFTAFTAVIGTIWYFNS